MFLRIAVAALLVLVLLPFKAFAQPSNSVAYQAHIQKLNDLQKTSEIFPPVLNAVVAGANDPKTFSATLDWLGDKVNKEKADGRYKIMYGGLLYNLWQGMSKNPNVPEQQSIALHRNAMIQMFSGYGELQENRAYCADQTAGQRIGPLVQLLGGDRMIKHYQTALSDKQKEELYQIVLTSIDKYGRPQLNWVCHDGVEEFKDTDVEKDMICTERKIGNSTHTDCQKKESITPQFVSEDVWLERRKDVREKLKATMTAQ